MNNRLRTSLLRALVVAAAGAMTFVLLGASPAAAHYVYEEGHVHRTVELCVHERSEISHGDGGGYSRVDVSSTTVLAPGGTFPCAYAYERPVNYIASRIEVMAWNGSAWYLCAETSWVYNSQSTWQLIIEARMAGLPYCGTGWYGTMGHGYVLSNNTWYGGALWSGSHWLPDYSLSAMEAPTEAPEPGDTVGVLDASGAEVLDADGKPVTVVIGDQPSAGPDAGGDAGTSVVAEDGSVVTEVPLHQTAELVGK
ncbi:hypothetical protein K3N28_22950 [Glycomyces sp. TRM65418]|uniref:hypothetical protein n=1 Tax=Glycomyces sp. TRM65418 TaxID=2867006 RepID=UPI001CE5418F|nr:hypothetical protein [Glycomyces sp. TRM65418]MCC3765922.1 hypothetical protein [Glycomyces sp. TRM65418]QZD55504.1 hypothetical protein K3N28_22825 [Glycomyces sp. TRM65418]